MADLSRIPVGKGLPPTGTLFFFYEAAGKPDGHEPDHAGSGRALYHLGDLSAAQLWDPPAPPVVFKERAVLFHREITIPHFDALEFEALGLTEDEIWEYDHLYEKIALLNESPLEAGGAVHRLLGHPDQVQDDMRLECQLASHGVNIWEPGSRQHPRFARLRAGAYDWRLLLQVDSDPPGWPKPNPRPTQDAEMMWHDVGKIYFWIQAEKLTARDFNRVWVILQAS
jgi:uncharacterized protein YwqG